MQKGGPTSQLTVLKPSVENVISYNQYKRTQPMVNGVPMINVPTGDVVILFGGGRHFLLGLLQFGQDEKRVEEVELFILSTGILLWFNLMGNGLHIPYESVVYHGSIRIAGNEQDGHRLELILTIESDKVLNQFFTGNVNPPVAEEGPDGLAPILSSIELTLRPKYSMYDRHYNPEIENLFTFENFGINRGDSLVNNCNEALAACLEMYRDPTYDDTENDDENDQDEAMFTSMHDTLGTYANSGLADDLDGDAMARDGPEAGMSLQLQ